MYVKFVGSWANHDKQFSISIINVDYSGNLVELYSLVTDY